MPINLKSIDLEKLILHKSDKDKYHDITCTWTLIKNNTKELIYKIEKNSQVSKSNLWLPWGNGGGIRRMEIIHTDYCM